LCCSFVKLRTTCFAKTIVNNKIDYKYNKEEMESCLEAKLSKNVKKTKHFDTVFGIYFVVL
jgi:hypothetical protein